VPGCRSLRARTTRAVGLVPGMATRKVTVRIEQAQFEQTRELVDTRQSRECLRAVPAAL